MNKDDVRWFAVLLRSPKRGYLLSRPDFSGLVDLGTVKLAGDGDYKVHEKNLGTPLSFIGITDLVGRML